MPYRLTERQAAFCRHLINGKTAAEAAREVGYKNAGRQAYQLLEKPHINEYLAQLRGEVETKAILSAQELQEWWSNLVRGQEDEAKIAERLKASELLGKAKGVFVDRQETSGELTIRVRRD